MNLRTLIAICAALLVGACATPGPYAIVSGERQSFADSHEESVRIHGVDGKLDPMGSSSVRVDPGFRMLLVRTTRTGGRRASLDATLPLNAKPCMRYHVVARHESQMRVDPWSLEIKGVEPIDECLAKYPGGVATK